MTFTVTSLAEVQAQTRPKDPIERHSVDGRPKIYTPCVECAGTGRVPGARANTTKQCPKCKGEGRRGAYYSRTTTYIDVLEDKSNLAKWQQRKVLEGVLLDPTLLDKAREIEDWDSPEGKSAAEQVCKWAQEAARTGDKADLGTALHEVTEEHDKGNLDVFVPEEFRPAVEAYQIATADLDHGAIEEFAVHDELKVAGTLDRGSLVVGKLAELAGIPEGTAVIADLKTGTIEFGFGKIVMQLATYARMQRYDPETLARTPLTFKGVPVSTSVGILIHMPSGGTTCTIYKLDLDKGWEHVLLARDVREARNHWKRVGAKPPALIHVDGSENRDAA